MAKNFMPFYRTNELHDALCGVFPQDVVKKAITIQMRRWMGAQIYFSQFRKTKLPVAESFLDDLRAALLQAGGRAHDFAAVESWFHGMVLRFTWRV